MCSHSTWSHFILRELLESFSLGLFTQTLLSAGRCSEMDTPIEALLGKLCTYRGA